MRAAIPIAVAILVALLSGPSPAPAMRLLGIPFVAASASWAQFRPVGFAAPALQWVGQT